MSIQARVSNFIDEYGEYTVEELEELNAEYVKPANNIDEYGKYTLEEIKELNAEYERREKST